MTEKCPSVSAITDGSAPCVTFAEAITEVARLTLALGSANATLDFGAGVRIRGELERALPCVQRLAERIEAVSERGEAMRQLAEMQSVAIRALMIAPSPSRTAILAIDAGDPTAWLKEEQAWIAVRLASGASSQVSESRRAHRITRPERPCALHGLSEQPAPATPSPRNQGSPQSPDEDRS